MEGKGTEAQAVLKEGLSLGERGVSPLVREKDGRDKAGRLISLEGLRPVSMSGVGGLMPDATCCLRIRVPERLRPKAGLHPEGLFLCGGRSLVVPWGSVLLSLPWTLLLTKKPISSPCLPSELSTYLEF